MGVKCAKCGKTTTATLHGQCAECVNRIGSNTCKSCGKNFTADHPWKKKCLLCWRRSLPDSTPEPVSTETRILRQVCLKVASEQVRGAPDELISYARGLEKAFNNWK